MRKKVFFICLVTFPFMLCSGIVYSILSLYFAKLGASKSQIGLIYTSGALAGAVMGPIWGRLADKWGRKVVLFISMGLFSLAFLGYALSTQYLQIFFIQIIEGMGWTAMGASTTALIADVTVAEHRGEAMGIYNTAWSIGWIIGPSLGGVLSDYLGFKTTFLICVFIMLSGILAGLFILPRYVETSS